MDDVHLSPFLAWLFLASWQASFIILLVLLAQRLFRSHLTPKWRYRLWLVVLVRLVLPFSPTSHYSIFNYANPRVFADIGRSLIIRDSNEGIAPAQAGAGAVGGVSRSAPNERAAGGPASDHAARPALPATAAPAPHVAASGWRVLLMGLQDYSIASQFVMLLVMVVWPAGIVVLVLKILRQNLGFALRVMQTPPMNNREVQGALEECKRLLDIDFTIHVVESKDLKTPALYGFFRPRLLLPEGLAASFSADELKYIFLHELAHVKRLDMAVNWLMTALQILHWFNPVIWVGFARIRADRELACDALVLSRVRENENESYGHTVIKLLESFVLPPRVSGLVGLLEEKHEMKRRIRMIVGFRRASQLSLPAALLILLLGWVSLTDATAPETRPTGLAGWWRGDGDARDSAGANNGVLEGAVSFDDKHSRRGFHFDGLDADVKIPASSALDVGKGTGFAVAAWIKPDKVDIGAPIIEWSSDSPGVSLWIIANFGPGALYAELHDDKGFWHAVPSPAGMVRPHEFQHVAFTYDGHKGMGAIYVNGELVTLTYVGVFTASTQGDVYLGLRARGDNAGMRFSGEMEDVQVFNTCLAAADIQKLNKMGRSTGR